MSGLVRPTRMFDLPISLHDVLVPDPADEAADIPAHLPKGPVSTGEMTARVGPRICGDDDVHCRQGKRSVNDLVTRCRERERRSHSDIDVGVAELPDPFRNRLTCGWDEREELLIPGLADIAARVRTESLTILDVARAAQRVLGMEVADDPLVQLLAACLSPDISERRRAQALVAREPGENRDALLAAPNDMREPTERRRVHMARF